ncbi:ATP-binding protein [Melioribacteraceae bacterium 4301-Me]|uniref:ATP-binding protein n=1 Tax=Pyranulibacter aquaticus TaxID=3163344 RepID=UPI00359BA61F
MMSFTNKSFRQIKFKMPLFWKFSLAIVTIVLVFGSINSILIYNNVQSALQTETEKRALFIAKSISNQITSALLFEDYVALQNTINSIKNIDSAIAYIFVLDVNDNLVVHTFEDVFPRSLILANSLSDNQQYNSQLIKFKGKGGELILDIAVPVLSGKVGKVRVGIIESFIQSDVQKTVNVFWIMVAVFLGVGIIGAFVFANFITKPIKTIQNVADNIELDQIGKKEVPQIKIREKLFDRIKMLFRAEDEIDILADKFNQMIIRLDKAYRDLQNAQTTIIQSEKLATVGTLTAGLAHEINNPVAGLQNCIRRIKNDPANIEQNKKYLVMMESAVEKIEKVVGSLLNFSRRQSGDFMSLSIDEIVENSLLLVSHRIEKLRISITRNFPSHLPKIKGNKNQLEQVMLNLFINCIDSLEEKISANTETERKIILSALQENNFVKVVIEDTGIGIPRDLIDKIYDPFFTTKSPGKGTGLGLSIVYNIIEAHNGKIYFESEEGKGTIVTLHLPIY